MDPRNRFDPARGQAVSERTAYATEVPMSQTRYQDSKYQYKDRFCNPPPFYLPPRQVWNVLTVRSANEFHDFVVRVNRPCLVFIYCDPSELSAVVDAITAVPTAKAKMSDLVLVDGTQLVSVLTKYGPGLFKCDRARVVRLYAGNYSCKSIKQFVLSSQNVRR